LERLTDEVSGFVLALAGRRPGAVPRTAAALRSLLGFLHAEGHDRGGLGRGGAAGYWVEARRPACPRRCPVSKVRSFPVAW